MKRMVLLLACWASLLAGVQADELFRWVDNAGKVHYGDTRPADATDVEKKKLSIEPELNADLPYETRRAQQNFPVTLYTGKGCSDLCDQAHSLLNKRGIPFSEKLLQTKEDVDAFKQLSGIDGIIPSLAVGKNFLKGFLESQWNSELDIAGYPKTASYRQRITPLPPPTPAPLTPPAPATTPAESQPAPTEVPSAPAAAQ